MKKGRRKGSKVKEEEVDFISIPIPKVVYDRKMRFPFRDLKVGGNCMVIKNFTPSMLRGYLYYAQCKFKAKYIVRRLPNKSIGVWRIE